MIVRQLLNRTIGDLLNHGPETENECQCYSVFYSNVSNLSNVTNYYLAYKDIYNYYYLGTAMKFQFIQNDRTLKLCYFTPRLFCEILSKKLTLRHLFV